ncbi:hypothetical protein [Paraburkholderia unamae]|uniref:Uncharacterized protein n=1 Tax=Paraburkholderia unamae TaxID=219649 RepID=A0ACC6RH20_9BURK
MKITAKHRYEADPREEGFVMNVDECTATTIYYSDRWTHNDGAMMWTWRNSNQYWADTSEEWVYSHNGTMDVAVCRKVGGGWYVYRDAEKVTYPSRKVALVAARLQATA